MKDFEITTKITAKEYCELDSTERRVVDAARNATAGAYAPYSKFSVGAAILLDNGEIVTGANQENAAFPSGTCAERTACFYAGAKYPEAHFELMAIAAIGTDGKELDLPISPCGACRQALLEYETRAGQDVPLLLIGRNTIYRLKSFKSLLPLSFSEF